MRKGVWDTLDKKERCVYWGVMFDYARGGRRKMSERLSRLVWMVPFFLRRCV